MKYLRFRIDSKFLETIGLYNMFDYIERIEILQTYRYDLNNFFSMQRISYLPGMLSMRDKILREILGATVYHELERIDNEVTYILKQNRKQGFWPVLLPENGAWALVPPISVDNRVINVTIIADEDQIGTLHEVIEKYTKNYDIIAQQTINISFKNIGLPFPKFTKRQREIASFAAKHGYFETPKRITAEEIAKHFKNSKGKPISVSAVNEHLRKAQQIAMKYFFG